MKVKNFHLRTTSTVIPYMMEETSNNISDKQNTSSVVRGRSELLALPKKV